MIQVSPLNPHRESDVVVVLVPHDQTWQDPFVIDKPMHGDLLSSAVGAGQPDLVSHFVPRLHSRDPDWTGGGGGGSVWSDGYFLRLDRLCSEGVHESEADQKE